MNNGVNGWEKVIAAASKAIMKIYFFLLFFSFKNLTKINIKMKYRFKFKNWGDR
jgi:hypothetical protein